MLVEFLISLYAVAAGFVAAGILASFYQLVTDRQPGFSMEAEGILASVTALALCVFAGPFILMRNAIRGRAIENRPVGWLAASAAIASGWSLCSGIVVIQFALTFL